jgi:squalene-hopene/tetraprenyl-beta-curcumene cyclase
VTVTQPRKTGAATRGPAGADGADGAPAGGRAGAQAGSAGRAGVAAAAGASAEAALERAREHLLGLQHADGWWKGELETNVTMDAEDLLLRQFLGVRTAGQTEAAARWIRSQQRDDGTWANFYGGPGDLSTTVEAYVALRLAGDTPEARHMARAAAFIRDHGGIAASRVFTRIWLAMFGQWPWSALPVMPPEMIYLPRWFPLNVYDWACWARQTIVPLTIVGSFRPVRPLPFSLPELQAPQPVSTPNGSPGPVPDGWGGVFRGLDRVLHVYERRPNAAVRRAALRRCAEWIIARQEADGCWGGIQPPWVYSLIALNLLGYRLEHPVLRRGLAGLDRFTVTEDTPDGPVRRLEACQSPVWDTVLAMVALGDTGLPAGHPALTAAASWVVAEETPGPGDWQVQRPDLAPGGWAFEFDNDGYPDTDDVAVALLALRQAQLPSPGGSARTARTAGTAADAAAPTPRTVRRALSWLTGMQSSDGGWGAFDADNTRQLVTKLPFCDFGAVIDPPSADVTAHVVEALSAYGMGGTTAVRRGVTWLLRAQEPDGSWFGRWGANYVYGTGAVLPALTAAGVKRGKPAIRRAVAWLEARQNPDGGWGEDLRSYDDPALAGQGETTPSQTAWALIGLLSALAPGERSKAVEAGVRWLVQHQTSDGTWDEPQFTGTGFPGDFYINYHLYRLIFPVMALGRYLRGGT